MIAAQIAAMLTVGLPFPGPAPEGRAFLAANKPVKVEGLAFVGYPMLKGTWLVNDRGYVVRSFAETATVAEIEAWRTGTSLPIGYEPPDPRETIAPLPRVSAANSWMDMLGVGYRVAIQNKLEVRAGAKGLLILFLSTYGPADYLYSERVNTISKAAEDTKLDVIALFPGKEETKARVLRFMITSDFDFPCAIDPGHVYADAYRATRTPEAFLVVGKKLVYTGALDDNTYGREGTRSYLLRAISNLAQGKPIAPASTRVFGTPIDR